VSAQIVTALINGLSEGMAIFLVAAGLTLIFGIMRILNFAHGGFFMIGAYVAATLIGSATLSIAGWIGIAIGAGLAIAAVGLVVDRLVLQRLRQVHEAYMLIATFAVLLLCQGATKLIWGVQIRSIDPPEGLDGALFLGGIVVPSLSLAIIAAGILVYAVMDLAIRCTSIGRLLMAIAHDPWMAQNLGLNVPRIFTLVVVGAFFLAGFAGGILLPNQSLSPGLAGSVILQAFICIIIGGVGNIRGAFIGAVLVGLVDAGGNTLMPNYPGLLIYFAMIVFLLFRPQGLFAGGRA
jgi:branched-subunit amino acid ABC-type transport system permease component